MSSQTPPIDKLPVETLTYILRLATNVPACYTLGGATYYPFHNSDRHENVVLRNQTTLFPAEINSWTTKLALPLVCSLWRLLSFEMLYEEIYIGERAHTDTLLETFEQSELTHPGQGLGRLVRNVVLASVVRDEVLPLVDVLRWCPNVEALVKSDDDVTFPPRSDVDLSSITRFDWSWIRHGDDREIEMENIKQGLAFYEAIASRAPNLQYLSIAIRYPARTVGVFQDLPTVTPSLTALRIQHTESTLRQEIEDWEFPKLTHIITDSSLVWRSFSSLFGPQIEVVEFTVDEALHTAHALGVIGLCPNLREINYHVEFAKFPPQPVYNDSLACVRLHSGRNYMLDSASVWDEIEAQLQVFAGASFPALKRIILYGDWDNVVNDSRFSAWGKKLRDRGCIVEDEYGTLYQQP
ncbi:hypothetical protein Hypma_013081 [Hypsizygus marmoreus]|uniref:F-box domain-containing protein n=1 Tax=Hypsizygus marmoreus TaxID=39966 RepID=A0A369JHN7_HYPMA|nr:hypothetical protein Hypma_013081 [Hypsizygus marmoreus]